LKSFAFLLLSACLPVLAGAPPPARRWFIQRRRGEGGQAEATGRQVGGFGFTAARCVTVCDAALAQYKFEM